MKKISSNWYTNGKFNRNIWKNAIDVENEFLYSKESYLTKTREKEEYICLPNIKEVISIFKYYQRLKNSNIYFISDTHFNHKNIIKYCNRPFKDVEEMNSVMVENWNNTITEFDTVFHLGDVALNVGNDMDKIISKLRGKKILIKGNHDNKSRKFFESLGFSFMPESPVKLDSEKLVLSHKPLKDTEIPDGYVNIHGHIHNNPLHRINPITNKMEYPENLYSERLHINVSVDVIDFKPISLEELLKKIEERK